MRDWLADRQLLNHTSLAGAYSPASSSIFALSTAAMSRYFSTYFLFLPLCPLFPSPSFRPPDDLYKGCPSSRSLSALILPLRATAEGTKGPGPAIDRWACEATLRWLGEAAKVGSRRGPLCRADGECWGDDLYWKA